MSSQGKGKDNGFVWDDSLLRYFLGLIQQYQAKNGKGQAYRWLDLTSTFEETTKLKCGKDTLKNKHGNLKDKWRLWKQLKQGETGLGWNVEKGCIMATDEWWTKKLQENFEFRKFRRQGIALDLEELLEDIFGGTVATGQHCVAPSMVDPPCPPGPGLHDTPEGQEVEGPPPSQFCDTHSTEDYASGGVDADIDQLFNRREGPDYAAPPGYLETILRGLDDVVLPASCPAAPSTSRVRKRSVANASRGTGGRKRNGRQSVGSTLYQEHMAASLEANRAMLSLWQSELTSAHASNIPFDSKAEAMGHVEKMIDEGMLVEGTPLWCFSVLTLANEEKRDMFLLI